MKWYHVDHNGDPAIGKREGIKKFPEVLLIPENRERRRFITAELESPAFDKAVRKAMMFEAVIDYLSGGTDDQLDLVKKRMAAYFDNAATVSPSLTSVKMLRAKKHEYLMEELKRVHTM